MIEGLKIKVTSGELKEHLTMRAAHHRKRADDKEVELPQLRDALERIKAAPQATNISAMQKLTSNSYHVNPDDTISALENDIRDHRNKALVFDFFAGHLFEEDYVLQENDLIRLEVIKRF
jgi:hypothetical protein